MYNKWGYFTEKYDKFQTRPQTYLATPGIHFSRVDHMTQEQLVTLSRTQSLGKSLESWVGLILSYYGFNIRDRSNITSKKGEFYLWKSEKMSVIDSMEFCQSLLTKIAACSYEIFAEWSLFLKDNRACIKNYIKYNSWDSIVKQTRRVDDVPIPSGIIDKYITSVVAARTAQVPVVQAKFPPVFDYSIVPSTDIGLLLNNEKFEKSLKLQKLDREQRILVVGVDDLSVIRRFVRLMQKELGANKLCGVFTLLDCNKSVISDARQAFSRKQKIIFVNDVLETHDFEKQKFDVLFSLVSGKATTIFVAALQALQASPFSVLLATDNVQQKCRAMECSSLKPSLFWIVGRRSQATDYDDSEEIIFAKNSCRPIKLIKSAVSDEAAELSSSDDSDGGSDSSSSGSSGSSGSNVDIGDKIGGNYTEQVKYIYSFSVSRNEEQLRLIVQDDLYNKIWAAKSGCLPFGHLIERRDYITIPIYAFRLTIPLAYSFDKGDQRRRYLTQLDNTELNEIISKFVFISIAVYDFVVNHMPPDFQINITRKEFSNKKSAEIFKFLKDQGTNVISSNPAMKFPSRIKFHFYHKEGDDGEEEKHESAPHVSAEPDDIEEEEYQTYSYEGLLRYYLLLIF